MHRMSQPGLDISRKVSKCMRSLYDSSSKVLIQPWSGRRRRMEWRWRRVPATIPGTPAIDSRKMKRTNYRASVTRTVERSVRTYPLRFCQRTLSSNGRGWIVAIDLLLRPHSSDEIHCPSERWSAMSTSCHREINLTVPAKSRHSPCKPISNCSGLPMTGHDFDDDIVIPSLMRPCQ